MAGAFGCPTLSVLLHIAAETIKILQAKEVPEIWVRGNLTPPAERQAGKGQVGKKSDQRNLNGMDIIDLINQTPLGKPNSGHQDVLG